MYSAPRKAFAVALFAIGLSFSTHPAQADPALPNLTNLNFLQYSGSAPKNYFSNVQPTGWTEGAGGGGLMFIDTPGGSGNPNTACGSIYLQTYGCPGTLAIPGGYNYLESDGNPSYEDALNYEVTGLTPGTTYTLSFYQAASQQAGFGNGLNTTEQWIVSLGTSGLVPCFSCGPADGYYGGSDSTYSNPDGTASVVATPLMTTPSGGLTDWNYVTVNLTADSTTDLLSFLAWGDNGNTVNLPPIVFLTGVNSAAVGFVPEPGSLLFLGIFLLILGGAAAIRRFGPAKA
jgi:hypothetical protein